jgi:hypothetical protein
MRNKVSSDWLPSYIKATRPVLEIFKMAGYFPDSPRKITSKIERVHDSTGFVKYRKFIMAAADIFNKIKKQFFNEFGDQTEVRFCT